jgi:hypothetical protein
MHISLHVWQNQRKERALPSLNVQNEHSSLFSNRNQVKECAELWVIYRNTPSRRGAQLKHMDKFIFTFKSRGLLGCDAFICASTLLSWTQNEKTETDIRSNIII